MLPITNHRVHVPHGLALGAAVVGLVIALNWERPADSSADLAPPAPAMVTLEDDSRHSIDPGTPGRDRETPRGREMLPGFGSLFLPFAPGR